MGRIFSIEEFSTFDGPGIRMTVFLKGCPLKCAWCHNPEGQSHEIEYMRSPNGCIACGKCEKAGEIKNGRLRLTAESVKACPKNLVRQSGEDYTAEALIEKIRKNQDILLSSGGGVTFSGGEPLLEVDFILECARLIPQLSIALQTSGYASKTDFEKALSVCDYVLYDLKLMDREAHIHYCGVDNERIKENYTILAKSEKKFVTRIPLIPGITDTEENLRSIASFMQENGVYYAELLPYNQFAGSKYGSLLRKYELCLQEEKSCKNAEMLFKEYNVQTKRM